jgi:hypothetical protein
MAENGVPIAQNGDELLPGQGVRRAFSGNAVGQPAVTIFLHRERGG